MKLATILAGSLLISSAQMVSADPGSFSHDELAAMGLSSVRVISDYEASSVRVYGSYPSRWGNAYPWIKGVRRLEERSIRVQRPFYPLRGTALLSVHYLRR